MKKSLKIIIGSLVGIALLLATIHTIVNWQDIVRGIVKMHGG